MSNDSYDAIIIGAGISGLVCGCYLAKAGMKVLIAEQHVKPGGYCTSFKRNNFTFDAAAHSFGGYRADGIVRKICNDLDIEKRLRVRRYDPSDIIYTPDHTLSFWSDIDKTIIDFQKAFPDERDNVRDFFHFLIKPDPNFFARIRNWTFKDLLDKYFNSERLKAVLSFPLMGNGALPPTRMSALIAAKIFQEFLLDGGYYPENGMQSLPDTMGERLKEFGGELRLSCPVTKITVKDGQVTGVLLDGKHFIPSRYVISNCDARQTFFKLLGKETINDKDFLSGISSMLPSLSIFILYLGLNNSFNLAAPGVNLWLLSNYNLGRYDRLRKDLDLSNACTMIRVMPGQKTLLAFVNVPYKSKAFWDTNKEKFMQSFIHKIQKDCLPQLSSHIVYQEAATPHTLYRYTLNYKGAAYGWACTPSQLGIPDLRQPSFARGLHLTGHWTTQGLGIPGVVYVGYNTAKSILRKETRTRQALNMLN